MSTASLPNYLPPPPPFYQIPSYTAEPLSHEQRLAHVDRLRSRSYADFVKKSKNGEVRLRLVQQENGVTLPVYGSGGTVAGTIDLAKVEGVTSVEAKVEGTLRLKEVAEGGTTSSKLCLSKALLWVKDRTTNAGPCPSSLSFSLTLPTTFPYNDETHPLPPTYEAHLSGVPGFRANIEYSVSAVVNKASIKTLFGITIGNTSVSTPFIYQPRTRPAVSLPSPMSRSPKGGNLVPSPEWRLFSSSIRSKQPGGRDIISMLYLPASRIFCFTQPIPFHIVFTSSAFSLASFLPLAPTMSLLSPNKQYTRMQLLRQTTVDVRNATVMGLKTDIWRVDSIGDGSFRHAGDGPDWIAFSGEVVISDQVKVGGFKAGGLSVKDCIVLSMDPPDPHKAPFTSLRQVIPVRLTTDSWTTDGSDVIGGPFGGSEYSIPSTPEDNTEAQPELEY